MTLTIDLKPELESRLRDEAARSGVNPDIYVVQALEQRLQQSSADQPRLSGAESDLLLEINAGPPGLDWERYRTLLDRNRDETITQSEHRELIAMIQNIEETNAKRIDYLIELARVRGVSLDALLDALGIHPLPVE